VQKLLPQSSPRRQSAKKEKVSLLPAAHPPSPFPLLIITEVVTVASVINIIHYSLQDMLEESMLNILVAWLLGM